MSTKGAPLHAARRSLDERNALVTQWQYLPRYAANRLERRAHLGKLSHDDAMGIGQLALLRAAELWNPERGILFKTYAIAAIIRRVRNVAREENVIHVPRSAWDSQRDPARFRCLAIRAMTCRKMPDEEMVLLGGLTRDGGYENAEELAVRSEALADAMRFLTERMCLVLRLRFWERLTLAEVGLRMRPGLTRERVRQIELEAVGRLRARLGGEDVFPAVAGDMVNGRP